MNDKVYKYIRLLTVTVILLAYSPVMKSVGATALKSQGKIIVSGDTVFNSEDISNLVKRVTYLEEKANAEVVTRDRLQHVTKTVGYAQFLDFVKFKPTKDTWVNIQATTYCGEFSSRHGVAFIQLYSTDGTKHYLNVIDAGSPYTGGHGSVNYTIRETFLAKAGCEYRIRVYQSGPDQLSYSFPVDICSNVDWIEI